MYEIPFDIYFICFNNNPRLAGEVSLQSRQRLLSPESFVREGPTLAFSFRFFRFVLFCFLVDEGRGD